MTEVFSSHTAKSHTVEIENVNNCAVVLELHTTILLVVYYYSGDTPQVLRTLLCYVTIVLTEFGDRHFVSTGIFK